MSFKQIAYRFRGPILIFLGVLLANGLFLTGIFSPNPMDQFSGVSVNAKVGVLSGYNTIDPNDAYTTQALGHAAVHQLAHGKLPWWNYNEQVGAPLAGEMQSASLFLPFNLLLGFSNGLILFHILLELIAGIATYYLLKKIGCSVLASAVGGLLFALNGTFAWLTNAAFNPIAFLPLLLLGVENIFTNVRDKKKNRWWIVLIAAALAASLYAGFPEVAFLDGLLVFVWALVRLFQLEAKRRYEFGLSVACGFFIGLLLAAPILVAFKDYYPYADVGVHTGLLKKYALPPIGLAALFMPYVYGPIFDFTSYDKSGALGQFWGNVGGYLSFSLLFFALIGFMANRKKSSNRLLVIALSIWILVTVARTYGFPELASILNFIPGISIVAFYRYIPASFELGVVILAMLGLDKIIKQRKLHVRQSVYVGVGLLILLGVVSLIGLREDHRLYLAPHHHLWLGASVIWAFLIIAGIVLTILSWKRYAKFVLCLILVVDAMLMFIVPQLSSIRSATIDTKPIAFLQQNLGNARFYSIGSIMPNYSSYFGIASINTNDLPIAKAWGSYITESLNSNAEPISGFTGIDQINPQGPTPLQAFIKNMPAYEAVSVKYVITQKNPITQSALESQQLKLVFEDATYQVYELPQPKPYFEALRGSCDISPDATKSTLTTQCSASSTLVRRELFMPGWTAKVNGKTTLINHSGSLFQEISVPAGKSTISFSFMPQHMQIAIAAAIVGILAMLGVIFYKRT